MSSVQQWAQCPECGTPVDSRHGDTCTVARCTSHGEQFIACPGEPPHQATVFRGTYPGAQEAADRGWFTTRTPNGTWITCPPDAPGATPDINRVLTTLTWDPQSEQYID